MPEQFDWISAVEQRYAAANDVAMKEWPRVATLDSRVVSALKDIPQLLAEIRKIRVATQVSPPTELGVCECGHGEGLHKFNYKNEPKQYRYDCRGCACENYRPKMSPSTPMGTFTRCVARRGDGRAIRGGGKRDSRVPTDAAMG